MCVPRPGIELWITQQAHYPLSYAGQLILWLQYAIDNLYILHMFKVAEKILR